MKKIAMKHLRAIVFDSLPITASRPSLPLVRRSFGAVIVLEYPLKIAVRMNLLPVRMSG